MDKLTAKVIRTYNASNTFQKELNKIYHKYDRSVEQEKINDNNLEERKYLNELIDQYNNAL